jgi:hypothetical protein
MAACVKSHATGRPLLLDDHRRAVRAVRRHRRMTPVIGKWIGAARPIRHLW